jgi:hypothetical protein
MLNLASQSVNDSTDETVDSARAVGRNGLPT